MCNATRVDLENELASILNELPNAIEMLVGSLSSITTEQQLRTLVQYLKQSDD